MRRPEYGYTAYGLHVRSPFPLPFFTSLPGLPHREPDVTIRIGAAPASLPAPADRRGLWESAPGAFLLDVPGVARYRVTDGRDVLVEPRGGGDREVGVFLTGPVFAALLQQRGVVTFHAGAVGTGAGAVLFAGRPGSGKSSLIAALVERGYAMLADDVTGVVLDGDGCPAALPAFPCLRLWTNVLDELAWPGQPLGRVRPELEKHLAPVERFHAAPLAVRAVCRLTFGNGDGIEIETLPAAGAWGWLLKSTYRGKFLHGLGQLPTQFRTVTELARCVPVMRATWPLRLPPFRIDALADRVEEHLREGGAAAPSARGGRRTPLARRVPPAPRAPPAPREDTVPRMDAFPRGNGPVAGEAPPPGHRRLKPVEAGLKPVEAGLKPVEAGLKPVEAGLKPVEAGLKPVEAGLKPVEAGLKPVEAGLKPVEAGRGQGGTPTASIVWLASYPKSGNTWLRAVLTNYLRDAGERGSHSEPASINALIGSPVAADRETFNEWVGLDSSDLAPDEVLRHRPLFHVLLARESGEPPAGERRRAPCPAGKPPREDTPAFVKVHDAYLRTGDGTALFPKEATAGVVYLVRNPLDVAVSYAHHLQKSIDDTVRWMNDPAAAEAEVAGGIHTQVPQPLLTWSGHVSSWLDQEELPIHVARYEDLLADPTAAFGAIVRFAGLGRGDGTHAGERGRSSLPGRSSTSARLARAVDHAAFSRLRAQEEASGFFEKQPTAPSFFRAGVAGSWRNVLDSRQVRALVDAHGPVMARLGYLHEAEAFLAGDVGPCARRGAGAGHPRKRCSDA